MTRAIFLRGRFTRPLALGLLAVPIPVHQPEPAWTAACDTMWENEIVVSGKAASMLEATVERRYKDGNGEWQSGNSFGGNDIPLVKYCLGKAFEAMVEERGSENGKVEEEAIE